MKRLLLPSTAFVRSSRRLARKHPQSASEIQLTLELLAEDAFHPQLKTHKLKGKLAASWACSAGYDLRAFFNSQSTRDRMPSSLKASARTTRFTE